jgi:hypothetical protein
LKKGLKGWKEGRCSSFDPLVRDPRYGIKRESQMEIGYPLPAPKASSMVYKNNLAEHRTNTELLPNYPGRFTGAATDGQPGKG